MNMESATNKQNHEDKSSRSSRTTRFIRDEATLSAFRKRNKKLIIVLLLLAITTLSTTGSILFHLVRRNHAFNKQRSAIRAFCEISTTSYHSTPCEMEYYGLMATRNDDTYNNPNKVLYVSLRTASEELEAIIRTWRMADDDTDDQFRNNCSIALRDAKGEISHCLEMILSSGTLAEEQRVEIWNRTVKARDGLKRACLESSSSSSSSSSSVIGQIRGVEMHLNDSEDYLMRYYEALRVFFDDVVDGKVMIFVGRFSEGMVGLQFLFMFFLILSLFRT